MMLLTIITSIPAITAEEKIETQTTIFDSMNIAHIKIDGSGSSKILASSFVLGFGRCGYMRFKLDESSHIEINKFLDQSDKIILDGSYIITIFGFIGFYKETDIDITLNGFSTLVFWR
jgi:hypothetical protein